jgi:molecular chaperone GrpE
VSARDENSQSGEVEGEESVLLPAEELVPSGEEARESEAEVLAKELALLEGQLQDMRERYLRAVADLDNARKRSRREMRDAQHRAAASVLLDILPIIDNFELALGSQSDAPPSSPETKAIYEGILLIYRQLVEMLAKRGVKPIPAVGERFDPTCHEAVAQVPAGPEQEEGMVALEVQKGYTFGDQVLRPSRVGVTVHVHKSDPADPGSGSGP